MCVCVCVCVCVCTGSFWRNLKETDYLEDIRVDGWRILKTNLKSNNLRELGMN